MFKNVGAGCILWHAVFFINSRCVSILTVAPSPVLHPLDHTE